MKLADKARAIRATLIERKRLRSPAQLRYAIADGIGMLNPVAWDALTCDAAGDLPIYLRLLHAGIADAIALNCKRVSFGRTALEPKAALGAKPQSFSILLRHRQPVLNKLIKRLLLGIEHDEAPDRNPFKKTAGL